MNVIEKLMCLTAGCCNCNPERPGLASHAESCPYRLASEVQDEISSLQALDMEFGQVEAWICMNTDFTEGEYVREHGAEGLIAALERLKARVRQWFPIKTVPDAVRAEARLVDLWSPGTHGYVVAGRWWDQDGLWLDEEGFPCQPTHWMPRPAPPGRLKARFYLE